MYPPRVAPLYYVAALGHICLAQRVILTRPQDLHVRDGQGCTPLHIAVLAEQVEVSRLLLRHTGDLNILDIEDHNLLHMAAYKAHFEITRMLLEHDWATKAHINARNKNGQTPLHFVSQDDRSRYMSKHDRPSIVALLLKSGADVDAQDNDNMTPLHCTIERSTYSEAAWVPSELGSLRHLCLRDGYSPSLESRWHPSGMRVEISFYYEFRNRVMDTQEYDNMTQLVCASEYFKSDSAAQLLLEHGASVHTRNKDGRTPLHLASEHELYDVVALLMKFGADVDAQDNYIMTPLHCAIASRRSLVAAQLILDHGASIHLQDKSGRTPLHIASRCGLPDVVALLLKLGAEVDPRDNDTITPLLCTSKDYGDGAVPQLLLENGASVNVRDKDGQTPLHLVSHHSSPDVVASLLKLGLDVDVLDNDRITPLLCALIFSGHSEAAQVLLEHGASVNVRDKDGKTPLHLASYHGFSDVVALLLRLGADMDALDNDRLTPLLCALKSTKRGEAGQVLVEHGASVHVHLRDENGQTPLHLAFQLRRSWLIPLLIKAGADLNAEDNDGMTPLLYAVQSRSTTTTQLLLEHGASVYLRNKNDLMPLHFAAQNYCSDNVVLLLQFGAPVDVQDNVGMTPLLYAVKSWARTATVQLLLGHGASVHLRNKNGLMPLHFAVQSGYSSDKVALLLQFGALVDVPDNDGMTPLCSLTFSRGASDTNASILLQHGASVHKRNKNGQTPLHFALRYNPSSVALLLQSGADVNSWDNNGVTLLHFALSSSSQDIFIDGGYEYEEGELLEENLKTIELLLEAGANIHLQNVHSKTPLQVAPVRERQEIEQLFSYHNQR